MATAASTRASRHLRQRRRPAAGRRPDILGVAQPDLPPTRRCSGTATATIRRRPSSPARTIRSAWRVDSLSKPHVGIHGPRSRRAFPRPSRMAASASPTGARCRSYRRSAPATPVLISEHHALVRHPARAPMASAPAPATTTHCRHPQRCQRWRRCRHRRRSPNPLRPCRQRRPERTC